MMLPRILSPLVLLVAASTAARGQVDTVEHQRWCWRGQASPSCSRFVITEVDYDQLLGTTRRRYVAAPGEGPPGSTFTEPQFGSRATWTVGPMWNTQPLRAVGATLSVSPVQHGAYLSLEARRRWWSPKDFAWDLSAGALRVDVPSVRSTSPRAAYGVTAGIHFVSEDIVNFRSNADLVLDRGRPHVGATLGAGFGSYMAAIVTPVALIVVGVVTAYAREGT